MNETLVPDHAIWDDGEWISWDVLDRELARIEARDKFPNADVRLIPIFQELLSLAITYNEVTGGHLQVYGDLGELFGAIMYGIELHKNYAQGSDGRLGNNFVEVKTITPFKKTESVQVRLDRHFNKLLVVKIDDSFEISGCLVDRKSLPKSSSKILNITWDQVNQICPKISSNKGSDK